MSGASDNLPKSVPTDSNQQFLKTDNKETAQPHSENLSDAKHSDVRMIVEETQQVSMRSGPLPAPAELAQYNEIIPDGANRIMKMAEAQVSHRIAIETKVITCQQNQAFRGQCFGLIIGLAGISAATFAAVLGQPFFGAAIGGTTLVSLTSAFLFSQHKQKAELPEKRPESPPPQVQSRAERRRQKRRGV